MADSVVEGTFGAFEEVTRSRFGFLVGFEIGATTSASDSPDSSASLDSSASSEPGSMGTFETKGALSSDSR